jgi:GH15 family glucan-1,4-alpha-glucosidase
MPVRSDQADVVRIVQGVSGRVPMRSELRLRFDYGSVTPWVKHLGATMSAVAGPDAVWLSTSVPLHGDDGSTFADFTVSAGERVCFVMAWAPSHEPSPVLVEPLPALAQTERFWTQWMEQCTYDGEWDDAVRRSLITLKALTYAPTGGIVAAPTTSLPETLGGSRNWDYRYCWLRDATFTLQALLESGFVEEARAWREWLLRAVAGDPADLKIMYGVDGTRRLPEQELPWLAGYESSPPVRIGNGAADQFQLDVWGEVLDGLHVARERGLVGSVDAWDLQRALMDFLEGAWDEPDNGLWEVRGPRRHFVHSKVMAWAGADRMVKAVEQFGLEGPVDRWRALRQAIHADVCARGYDADRGTFTQYYGSTELDASLLLIPRVGFLPYADQRVRGTVRAVEQDLLEDGFLLRYRTEAGVDGLEGKEGAFLACSFWLVNALHGVGPHRGGALAVRAAAVPAQRRRAAGRGVGPALPAAGRQLPAGVQPRAAGGLRRHLERRAAVDGAARGSLSRFGAGAPLACEAVTVERRIFGIENEYGVTCTFRGQRRLSPDEVARYLFRRVVSWGRSSNVFLRNGRRLYLDVGSHPEYATPECDSAVDLVTHDKAGERILEGLLMDAERRLREEGIAGDIYLFKNNTDSAGNSYGCHENYLVGRQGEFSRLADVLIPFLVSRRSSSAPARCCRPRAAPSTASASGPSTSGRASPARPRAAARSSTPATSRTPTPSASAGCTSSSATAT